MQHLSCTALLPPVTAAYRVCSSTNDTTQVLHIGLALPFSTCDFSTLVTSNTTMSATWLCTLNLPVQHLLLRQVKLGKALTLMLCRVCALLQTASATHVYSRMTPIRVWCRLSMTTDRPTRFTFQLVQLSTPGVTKNLLLLHDKHQQVHTSCLGGPLQV